MKTYTVYIELEDWMGIWITVLAIDESDALFNAGARIQDEWPGMADWKTHSNLEGRFTVQEEESND